MDRTTSSLTRIQLGEAKRRYAAHFVSKLTDADGENSETNTWLDFARDCGYLVNSDHKRLRNDCERVCAMLGRMLNNPESFLMKKSQEKTP